MDMYATGTPRSWQGKIKMMVIMASCHCHGCVLDFKIGITRGSDPRPLIVFVVVGNNSFSFCDNSLCSTIVFGFSSQFVLRIKAHHACGVVCSLKN